MAVREESGESGEEGVGSLRVGGVAAKDGGAVCGLGRSARYVGSVNRSRRGYARLAILVIDHLLIQGQI
jgi:hypothetical protein